MPIAPENTERPPPKDHYEAVVRGFKRGRVTPVLGAGASLCGRPEYTGGPWDENTGYAPSSQELSAYLAKKFKYPAGESADLLRVSQYIYATQGGSGPLYDELHDLFATDYPRTPVHDFLAWAPDALREEGLLRHPPVILTTNYDNLMEAALVARGEPFDLVVYMAEGPHEGQFCHRPPDGALEPIEEPGTYLDVDPERRTVVLKIHGFVDPERDGGDSFVITEDHYIEYLTRTDLDNRMPVKILTRLRDCHFLFLGYSLRDWNMRAMLLLLHAQRTTDRDWWAIQSSPDALDLKSWGRRNVDIHDLPLEEYIQLMNARFKAELGE